MAEEIYDFCGWATRNNVRCADGLTIMRDAFKHNDGQTVPIVWNHSHNDPDNVLGHGRLENRDEGVYIYGKFNDTERGRLARNLVQHGDIEALSIYANHLKKNSGFVMHGDIREVSLVLAGANPGAYIEEVIRHGDDDSGECAVIYTGEELELSHNDTSDGGELHRSGDSGEKTDSGMEDKKMAEDTKKQEKEKEEGETVGDVWETLTDKQKTAVYAVIAQAIEDNGGADDADTSDSEEKEDKKVKHNIFESDRRDDQNYLSHSDEENILNIAKSNSVGSLQDAISIYAENNDHLAHGFDSLAVIPEKCFGWCSGLQKLALPECLLSIENNAFAECRALTRLIVPENTLTVESPFSSFTGGERRSIAVIGMNTKLVDICGLTISGALFGGKPMVQNLTVYCLPDSEAQRYCLDNGVPCRHLSEFPAE